METQRNAQKILLTMMMVFMYFINADVYAQRASISGISFTGDTEPVHVITKLSSDYIAGKVMINWTVVNMEGDCIYQVERASDKSDFEIIGLVKGFATIGNYETLYSYIDREPLEKNSYYRVSVKSNPKVQAVSEKIVSNNYMIQTDPTERVALK